MARRKAYNRYHLFSECLIMWYPLLRSALFQLPPEKAHHLTLAGLAWAERMGLLSTWPKPAALPVEVMGLSFANPVGLSAGLDKNAEFIDALAALGFGFIEVGTVTPKPQPGNPQPRMFRLPTAGALINRLGFNNLGVDNLIRNVERSHYQGILGINIGKNASTPVEHAVDDYLICLDKVYAHADYVTINISSPNTQGLRSLQNEEALERLLHTLKDRQQQLASQHGRTVPMAVKIAPDLIESEVEAMAVVFERVAIDAVIATNTTISRDLVQGLPFAQETGGLSGRPVRASSTQVLRQFADALGGRIPLIGVGGIDDAVSAGEKIQAGASLVQVYTGFIYQGPALIHQAVQGIASIKQAATS